MCVAGFAQAAPVKTVRSPVALGEVTGEDTVDAPAHVLDGDAAAEILITHVPNAAGDIATAIMLDSRQPCVLEGLSIVNGQSKTGAVGGGSRRQRGW